MSNFVVGDWHLGEERMVIMGRPFKNGTECVDEMILRHNSIVKPEDTVIVAGDVCYLKAPEMLHRVAEFNGRKTLVRGNHDRGISDDEFSKYFEMIVPDGGHLILDAGGIKCTVTHYPTTGHPEMFNLVGHVHSAWKYQLNMMNVGVDVNHFFPTDLARIPFHFDAICKYYDQDVWVAYNPINSVWQGLRGKAGTYF